MAWSPSVLVNLSVFALAVILSGWCVLLGIRRFRADDGSRTGRWIALIGSSIGATVLVFVATVLAYSHTLPNFHNCAAFSKALTSIEREFISRTASSNPPNLLPSSCKRR